MEGRRTGGGRARVAAIWQAPGDAQSPVDTCAERVAWGWTWSRSRASSSV